MTMLTPASKRLNLRNEKTTDDFIIINQPTKLPLPHTCLIRPPSVSSKYDLSVSLPPPIGIAYLSSAIKTADYEVTVVDAIGEAPDKTYPGENNLIYCGLTIDECANKIPKNSDVIGISVMFSLHWPTVKRLIRLIRFHFPKSLIIIGGEHATAMAEYSLVDCPQLDLSVIGEGEETIVDLLKIKAEKKDLSKVNGLVFRDKNGEIKRTKPRSRISKIDDIARPDWESLPIRNYHKHSLTYGVVKGVSMPILASRGCPYQCTFCSNPTMWTTKWVARDPDDLIDEMQQYQKKYGATDFSFYDLTAIVKKDWIVTFCNKLLEKKMNISWQLPSGTRTEALDKEVCDLLYRTGCHYLAYTPESASENTLKRIKKKIKLERLEASMKASIDLGMVVRFNIIIGFPAETRKDIYQSLSFIFKMAIYGATDVFVNIYSPYPGSELFDDLKKEGIIQDKLDDDYFHSLTFTNAFAIPAVKCNKNISIVELVIYRSLGLFGFYIFTYLAKPVRIFYTFQNILNNKTESAFENALTKFLQKFKLIKNKK